MSFATLASALLLAAPLLPVPGRPVATAVDVREGLVHVRFGFRVRAPASRLWKIVTDFKRYPRYVDGLQRVQVRRRGGARVIRLRGVLRRDYDVRAEVKTAFREGSGRLRWRVVGLPPPNTGEIRVDPAGRESILSLATVVPKGVDLPDFLVKLGLTAGIAAAADALRALLETKR